MRSTARRPRAVRVLQECHRRHGQAVEVLQQLLPARCSSRGANDCSGDNGDPWTVQLHALSFADSSYFPPSGSKKKCTALNLSASLCVRSVPKFLRGRLLAFLGFAVRTARPGAGDRPLVVQAGLSVVLRPAQAVFSEHLIPVGGTQADQPGSARRPGIDRLVLVLRSFRPWR